MLMRVCLCGKQKLVEQAKTRAAELRRELEAGKKTLLDALEAEKENLHSDQGRDLSARHHSVMPKDSELSTSHAELKMETNGKVFFIDLDSTNGSFIDDQSVEAHEPHELRVGKPVKVEVGGGELELTLKKKS
ncbi:hypothetical protein BBJ28_00007646 [Nothophytophthora sp. Chile5]|nr:hypothetical protein BBJ28_00007646 [Nothophytophthora sp. Chile5]